VVRILATLWLTAGLAAASEPVSILGAKLRAVPGGFPCLLHGAVTMRTGPGDFYLQDETSGVGVAAELNVLKIGERLEVEGWMYLADSGEFQVRARRVRHVAEGVPLLPRLITLAAALDGTYQGQLVSVRGTVLNVDFGSQYDTISVRSGRHSLRIFHPANRGGVSAFDKIYPDMQVAVTGISVPQTVDPESDGYQVRLRGPSDLEIRAASADAAARTPPQALAWLLSTLAAMLAAGAVAWMTFHSRPRRAPPAPQVQ
jgi:hypothetical protein